jgi:hypothetical protein
LVGADDVGCPDDRGIVGKLAVVARVGVVVANGCPVGGLVVGEVVGKSVDGGIVGKTLEMLGELEGWSKGTPVGDTVDGC